MRRSVLDLARQVAANLERGRPTLHLVTDELPPDLAVAEHRLDPDGPGWLPWQAAELGDLALVRDDLVELPAPYNNLVRYSRAELVQLYTDRVTGAELERVHQIKTIFGGRVVRGEA